MPRLDRKGLVLAALLASVLPEGGDAFYPAHVVRTVRTGGPLRQEGVIVASSAGGNDEEAYYGGAQGEGNRNRGPAMGPPTSRQGSSSLQASCEVFSVSMLSTPWWYWLWPPRRLRQAALSG